MDRLTDINQTQIDAWRANNGNVQPGDAAMPPLPECNLKTDDHVTLGGYVPMVVYGPADSGTSSECFMGGYEPWFGEMVFPFMLVDVTDRVGPPPGLQGMPIYDEPEEETP